MDFLKININQVLETLSNKPEVSKLGFFSKPYKINIDNKNLIVKCYKPTKNADYIINLHNDYVKQLAELNIEVPETYISKVEEKNKHKLVILQNAFEDNELVRTILSNSDKSILLNIMQLLFEDTIKFWNNNKNGERLGFHPTLRNYALRNNQLYYFDTFPPMNLTQKELNKLIIQMAPVVSFIKPFVPLKSINRVSDEYYSVEKMITGLIGSCVRLRPEFAETFLDFSRNYIPNCDLAEVEKNNIIAKINEPPKLSFIWRFVRKLTGNVGAKNVG